MTESKRPPYAVNRHQDLPVESLNLEAGIQPYLHILRNRKGVIAACVFTTLLIAFVANITQRPVYQAATELLLEPKESKDALTSDSNKSTLMQDPTLMMTQFRLIRSRPLAERVLEKVQKPENRESLLSSFGVKAGGKRQDGGIFSEKEKQNLIGRIQTSLAGAQPDRNVRLIKILSTGYQPQVVALVSHAASEAYIELNHKSNMESFRQSFMMISQNLAEVREKIKTGELAFQKIDSEVKLLEALKIYGERHPLVIQLQNDIPQLARRLKREIQSLESIQVGQRKDLTTLLTVPNTKLEDLQKIETDLYNLKPILEQEVTSQKEMYNSIFRKLQEVGVSGGGSVWVDAEIVEPASAPSSPIRPNKKLNLILGFFTGIALGIGLAFFQEYLDSSVRSLEDVRGYLKLFPLGMVPFVQFNVVQKNGGAKTEDEIAMNRMRSPRTFWLANDSDIPLYVAEAYRIIRANLAFGSIDSTLKILQVTSAVKGEGKTTTTANLAVSLALAGEKILIVDADMRRPALHRILDLEGVEEGLSDALTHEKSWESFVMPTATPNLFFLSAGSIPPNPAELLSSRRMKAFMEELTQHFDRVIIDSPPVISVADAAVIASQVDGTILVSRAGFVPRHLCLQAKSAIESVNGRIVGCVLNSVHSAHLPYYYHQYYHEYGRYDEDKTNASKNDTDEEPVLKEPSTTLDKLKVLKEPLLILLSSGWARLGEQFKKGQPKKESKSSVGA